MPPALSIAKLCKIYSSGFEALKNIDLEIGRGEIFALLGPNGAGKSTLINIVCGIVTASSGRVLVEGDDIVTHYRRTRSAIGLVPQELTTDAFETVWDTVSFSRGLFGRSANPGHVEKILRQLSLWDKKGSRIRTLSGGMKRRVLIAKALAHEPTVLFLDEPTAGVDVELRRDMWNVVRGLRASGVTVILTTHYIDEAEEMADRVGVIDKGEIILVEEKTKLMRQLGRKKLKMTLQTPLPTLPPQLERHNLTLSSNRLELVYTYDAQAEQEGIAALLNDIRDAGVHFVDLQTEQSSLEEIFVNLVRRK